MQAKLTSFALLAALCGLLLLPTTSAANYDNPAPAHHIVALDPGHGGRETGGAHVNKQGKVDLYEKTANLAVARLLAANLRDAGYIVVMTRNADTGVNVPTTDRNGNGVIDTDDDLQARVDIANAAHADILLSLHHDSRTYAPATDMSTVYYCPACAQAAPSYLLARSVSLALSQTFALHGWQIPTRGVIPDSTLGKPSGHLYLLGPHNWRIKRPSTMPGALAEPLFLTNDYAYQLETAPGGYQVLADAYYLGITNYFDSIK